MEMLVTKYENREDWLAARRGKITGSRLKDVVSVGGITKEMICKVLDERSAEYKKTDKKEVLETLLTSVDRAMLQQQLPKKLAFYELIAERLGLPADGENPMERGSRMEEEVAARFTHETGKKLNRDLVIWSRVDDDSIAISPDATVEGEDAAAEFKCLGSARHIKAFIEQAIPDEYRFQVLQYFIVNARLKKLHFCFYDPRVLSLDFFIIEVTREQVQAEVDEYLEYEKNQLAQVREIVNKLTF